MTKISTQMGKLRFRLLTFVMLLAIATSFSPAEQKTAISQSPVMIDVRTALEYKTGHIPGALLMPHDEIEKLIAEKVPSKETPIIVYCRSGRRSGIARETLLKMGYRNVENGGSYEQMQKRH